MTSPMRCGCGLAWVTGSDPDSPYSKERKRREKPVEKIRQKWNRKQFPDEDDQMILGIAGGSYFAISTQRAQCHK